MSVAAQQLTFEADIVSVPREAFEHLGFRRWLTSAAFPEHVRATFAERELFVDMSPESIESHNKVKGAVTAALEWIVRDLPQPSRFLGRAFRLGRRLNRLGRWTYLLDTAA